MKNGVTSFEMIISLKTNNFSEWGHLWYGCPEAEPPDAEGVDAPLLGIKQGGQAWHAAVGACSQGLLFVVFLLKGIHHLLKWVVQDQVGKTCFKFFGVSHQALAGTIICCWGNPTRSPRILSMAHSARMRVVQYALRPNVFHSLLHTISTHTNVYTYYITRIWDTVFAVELKNAINKVQWRV